MKAYGSKVLILFLSFWCATASSDNYYEGYYIVRDGAPWFDASRSQIQYQDTIVASDASAWSGIDNYAENIDAMRWIQGGWGKHVGGTALVYWEYQDNQGQHHIGHVTAPAPSEIYEQRRSGDHAQWVRGGDVIYKEVDWSKFAGVEFCKVQYGAETHSTQDRIPGTAVSKNNFAASAARLSNGDMTVVDLSTARELDTAVDGHVEIVGPPQSGSFRTWDSR